MFIFLPFLAVLLQTLPQCSFADGTTELPNVEIPFDPNHKLLYRNHTTEELQSLGHYLKKSGAGGNYFYAALGAADDHSHTLMQMISYNSLNRMLQSIDAPSKAVCINNDFKDNHVEEGEPFSFFAGEVHDFGELGVDFALPEDQVGRNFPELGMWIYSWNDCIDALSSSIKSCPHIIQIRNYGDRFPEHIGTVNLSPVFQWIERDMERQVFNTPMIVVFQHFNHELPQIVDYLQDIVNGFQRPINLLGVSFAMMDRNVTLNKNLCQHVGKYEPNHAGRSPVLIFGGLPEYAYFILEYNPFIRGLKRLYVADTAFRTKTLVTKIEIDKLPCVTQLHEASGHLEF